MFAPISREGALVVNNLLLTHPCTVLIGTLYPLRSELVTGDKISVGPPFFNLTFGPLILPLLLFRSFCSEPSLARLSYPWPGPGSRACPVRRGA
jgi:cytochrome c-type biogenesis protein CcmF